MNDNWPDASEGALDAARSLIDTLINDHAGSGVPGLIGALVHWAVQNDAAVVMARALTAAAELLPRLDADWKNAET